MKNKEVKLVPLSQILPGDNPRENFDPSALAELMQSMKHQGLLQPIGLRKLANDKYRIVYGHRRFLSAQKLGWESIEGLEIDIEDERDNLIKTSTENVIRENISLPEQGRIYAQLLKKGMTAQQVAARMGCSKGFVNNALKAFQHIPRKYRGRITYGTRGVTPGDGSIASSVALAAVNIKKETKMNDEQLNQLMDWAVKKSVGNVKMRTAGAMLSQGVPIKSVIEKVDHIKVVSLTLLMPIENIQKLQQKHKKNINEILYSYLERNKEFGVVSADSADSAESEKTKVIVRKRPAGERRK